MLPFETIIQSYVDTKLGVDEYFINKTLAKSLTTRLLTLFENNLMVGAGTGDTANQQVNQLIRNDKIFWLDRSHNDESENAFLDHIDQFVTYLNSSCFTGITGYEFHFVLYEKGSFYKKHFDRFKNNGDRAFSVITYLNPDWVLNDGGELCIHQNNTMQHIAPENCKGVFFKSDELEHEVLVTNVPRLSITGWLKTN